MRRLTILSSVDSKYNDLVQFDPSAMAWTSLTSSILGVAPCPRDSHGFAALDDKVYIFGGNGSTTQCGVPTGSMRTMLNRSQRRLVCSLILSAALFF